MLEPFFFQCQGGVDPDVVYRILGYSRVGEYTLVRWRLGGEEFWTAGEDLYKGRVKLAGGGGELDLYQEADRSETSQPFLHSIWHQVNTSVGNYGLPIATAIALRDPANYVAFED